MLSRFVRVHFIRTEKETPLSWRERERGGLTRLQSPPWSALKLGTIKRRASSTKRRRRRRKPRSVGDGGIHGNRFVYQPVDDAKAKKKSISLSLSLGTITRRLQPVASCPFMCFSPSPSIWLRRESNLLNWFYHTAAPHSTARHYLEGNTSHRQLVDRHLLETTQCSSILRISSFNEPFAICQSSSNCLDDFDSLMIFW